MIRPRRAPAAASIAAVLLLSACSMMPLLPAEEEIHFNRSILTAERPIDSFARRDQASFASGDAIHLVTIVSWNNPHVGAGDHEVQWRWYQNGRVAVTSTERVRLSTTPYEIYGELPAVALGVGFHKVECLLDGVVIDSREFDVSP